jgi:alpha-tubulin suppressor-like RCC1 family protein
MHRQSLNGLTALLVTALACRDDTTAPTHVVPSSSQTTVAAAAALIFWQLSAGDGHTCGVTLDNRAYCRGWNGGGELGDGTTTTRL